MSGCNSIVCEVLPPPSHDSDFVVTLRPREKPSDRRPYQSSRKDRLKVPHTWVDTHERAASVLINKRLEAREENAVGPDKSRIDIAGAVPVEGETPIVTLSAEYKAPKTHLWEVVYTLRRRSRSFSSAKRRPRNSCRREDHRPSRFQYGGDLYEVIVLPLYHYRLTGRTTPLVQEADQHVGRSEQLQKIDEQYGYLQSRSSFYGEISPSQPKNFRFERNVKCRQALGFHATIILRSKRYTDPFVIAPVLLDQDINTIPQLPHAVSTRTLQSAHFRCTTIPPRPTEVYEIVKMVQPVAR
ncbi:hypothetical protein CALCODRAFT_506424 [Calocera cornea HHB12733]|uniref:Uncharacterized protein n=1 Tax=Calocera cornea HHB12733 TaxID=1353952 RepID=A0A165J0R9_9BASI|nr:hypothetical protein CALCODRAFT_506424 [Calocera cornea HHB12733]